MSNPALFIAFVSFFMFIAASWFCMSATVVLSSTFKFINDLYKLTYLFSIVDSTRNFLRCFLRVDFESFLPITKFI